MFRIARHSDTKPTRHRFLPRKARERGKYPVTSNKLSLFAVMQL